ncbi:hypothetical protein CYMTET_43703 [Cymbomonas tetramitiformis]|uniref:Importin N-terminal domain-containing protein n=1 Tax=Cymbomonas tetramitiformis TaxID=36881 RepID=A0AAE0F013_9CHLO|nr:hypothetical protein CYMTET_43703 [Cymbomonas tetramitiformis]
MDVTALLTAAQNPDPAVIKGAEDAIETMQNTNYQQFATLFVQELANEQKPASVRRMAGLLLKNSLYAKEEARRKNMHERWLNLDPTIRDQIKAALLQTLVTAATTPGAELVPGVVAMVIAKIAGIELPYKQWSNVIVLLRDNIAKSVAKQATLETLGYICECEEIDADSIEQTDVDSLLTAIVQGICKEEPDNNVRLTATEALMNAIEFADENFKKENERNYIMQVVCEATLCSEMKVRRAAYECLVKIHEYYYDEMANYIKEVFNLTVNAARTDEEDVALQAIELWSTLCEREMPEDYEVEDEFVNHKFVKQAVAGLVPMLLETLTKQDEDSAEDEDAWTLSMAGAACLQLCAKTVEDDIVPLVLPYVEHAAVKTTWRDRDAALMAFSCLLDGPDRDSLKPKVAAALPFVVEQMKFPSPVVKHTASYTIGLVCENVPEVISSPEVLQQILGVLLQGLQPTETPKVAAKVCEAVGQLAGAENQSKMLTPYFTNIVTALIQAAEREDCTPDLKRNAYEAVNIAVKSCTDGLDLTMQLLNSMIQKLHETLGMPQSNKEEQQKLIDAQALFCGVLQTIIEVLTSEDKYRMQLVAQFADNLMTVFLAVLKQSVDRSNSVPEECMNAVSSLIIACEKDFIKYIEFFFPYVDKGLENKAEYEVCKTTIGVISDISRALKGSVSEQRWDAIVMKLLENVGSDQLHRSVKPPILECFGDIALSVGAGFEKYLPHVAQMLQSASNVSLTDMASSSEDDVDHHNDLRQNILVAYSCIFQGMSGNQAALGPIVQPFLGFLAKAIQDPNFNEDPRTNMAACQALADLAVAVEGLGALLGNHIISAYLSKCAVSKDSSGKPDDLSEAAVHAQRLVAKQLH